MHVDHAALRVADLDATRSFYEGVLGLEPDRTFDLDGRHYSSVWKCLLNRIRQPPSS